MCFSIVFLLVGCGKKEEVAYIIDNIVLIGHSMGGPEILEETQLMSKRVIGLVGVDSFVGISKPWTQERVDNFLAPQKLALQKRI